MPKSKPKSRTKTKTRTRSRIGTTPRTRPKTKSKRGRKSEAEFVLLPRPEISRKPQPAQRSWRVALLLSLFLGPFGVDRFYLGRTRSAIIKLVTLSCFGVWWLTDFVLIASDWRLDAWGRPLKH